MIALVPFRIEAILQRPPIANRIPFGTTIAVSLLALYGPDAPWDLRVLARGNAFGLPGHLLLHADLEYLAGNMLILWVFGSAVCANMGNLHLGGLATGIVVGLIGLQSGWFRLTEFDRPTLLELWRERRG